MLTRIMIPARLSFQVLLSRISTTVWSPDASPNGRSVVGEPECSKTSSIWEPLSTAPGPNDEGWACPVVAMVTGVAVVFCWCSRGSLRLSGLLGMVAVVSPASSSSAAWRKGKDQVVVVFWVEGNAAGKEAGFEKLGAACSVEVVAAEVWGGSDEACCLRSWSWKWTERAKGKDQ